MAYETPPAWAYLDRPTAAKMNAYKNGLDAIYAQVGGKALNPMTARRMGTVQGYYMVHRQRWLLYRGEGRIEDPAGAGETQSLTDAGGGWASFDLQAVDWIYPGKLYQVQGVEVCLEDVEGF